MEINNNKNTIDEHEKNIDRGIIPTKRKILVEGLTDMKNRRLLLTWMIAFAMAFTVIPSTVVCADEANSEPTKPASEMTKNDATEDTNENQQGVETSDPAGNQGTSDEVNQTDEISETETESTTTTTTAPTKITTTINTSGKRWVTPKGNKSLSLTICRNSDGTVFDLMRQAGQSLYAYDTLQGATAGKGFGYFSLYNRKNNTAKIVKVRLYDMKVIKVSGVLDVRHANELAYNGRNNTIVVANADPTPKRITVVDANSLGIRFHKILKMPKKIKGMSKKQCRKFKGIGVIAYNEKYNFYVCRMRKTNDLLLLNANFVPYKRIKQNAKVKGMLFQGLDSYKDYIMVCQSFKGKKRYNLITVYNMRGKKIARFTMALGSPARELETVFHDGNQFYAGCYCCYGAKSDLQKLHIKRENYIYRINNL